jgi:hypothetical protein
MLLAREWARTLDAELPCGHVPALSGAGDSVEVLSTARHARAAGGLEVVRAAKAATITVRVGDTVLARVATRSNAGCSFRIRFAGGAWAVDGPGEARLRGTVESPPRVYGLLTELDLKAEPPLRVAVEPIPQDSRPSARQTALRIFAALLLAGALLAVVAPRFAWRPPRARVAGPAPQDGLVATTLVVWWLLAPLQADDGWVRARQLNSVASGGLSNYYRDWGANLPLGTWLEWLQHFLLAHTSALAYERLPALVALMLTWLACRWCLVRLLGTRPARRDIAWWSSALAFAVGAVAFGMTLRPEPLIALLAVGALACAIAFVKAPSLSPLTLALLLGVLAITIYPSGIVAAAPLMLCIPTAIRSARWRAGIPPLRLAALLPIGAASTILLVFLDADKTTWDESRTLGRASGSHGKGILDEVERYRHLADDGASPLRRLFVALLLLLGLAFLVGWLRRRPVARSLPSASVALALVLLVLTPSKWLWHFGGLVGLCAVAVGFEVHRLSNAQMSRFDRVLLLVPLVGASVWSATTAYSWGPLDVGSIDWNRVPAFFLAAVLLALGAAHIAGRVGLVRTATYAVLPAVLLCLLVVTLLAFTVDAAATNGWTTARQTVSSLVGRDGCGVATDVDVALPRSGAGVIVDRSHSWFPASRRPIGVFLGGSWSRDTKLIVEWGRSTSSGTRIIRSGPANLHEANVGTEPASWRFVAEPSFPRRPRDATLVRFAVRPAGKPSGAVSAPQQFVWTPLDALASAPGVSTLAAPTVLPALPCARLPKLEYGVAEAPDVIINFDFCTRVRKFSCTFTGVPNIFDLERLPQRSLVGGGWLPVYRVRVDPRDAIAPAQRSAPL